MPLNAQQIAQIKADFKIARKKELNFGLCIGKKPDTTVLLTHKTRAPATLGPKAKKAGDTSKVAFGTMTVAGKELFLKCLGKPPTGLARKTKEFFKLANLKVKVIVLDAEGAMLESDGEAEPEDGPPQQTAETASPTPATGDQPKQPESPLTAEWEHRKTTLLPEVKRYVSAGLPEAAKVKADWVHAGEMAGKGQFDEAIKTLKNMETLIHASGSGAEPAPPGSTKNAALVTRWEAAVEKMSKHVKEVLDAGKGDVGKIRAVWAYAKEKGDSGDPAAGMKALGPLAKLIAAARAEHETEAEKLAKAGGGSDTAKAKLQKSNDPPAQAPLSPQGQEEQVSKGGTVHEMAPPPDQSKADEAKAKLEAEASRKKLEQAKAELKSVSNMATKFGEKAPATWKTGLKEVTSHSNVKETASAAEIEDTTTKLNEMLLAIKNEIVFTTAEREKWRKGKEVFGLRFDIVKRHPLHAEDPPIKGKIAAVVVALGEAQKLADKTKFQDAIKALVPLIKSCDDIEALADELSHYKAILALREALVAETPGTTTPFALVNTLATKAKALLTEAKAKATAGDYKTAVEKLNLIPDAKAKAKRMFEKANEYEGVPVGDNKGVAPNFLSFVRYFETRITPASTALFQPIILRMRAAYDQATTEKATDYGKALRTLTRNRGELWNTYAKITAAESYATKEKAHTVKLAAYKAHDGKGGIAEFILLMERDLADAKAQAAALKFSVGIKLLDANSAQWATYDLVVEACKKYVIKKKTVDVAHTALKAKANAATAQKDMDQIAAFVASAVTAGIAKEFGLALKEITEAERRIGVTKTLLENDAALAAKKDTAALGSCATDFAGAFKVFSDMKAAVELKDPDGHFTTMIATTATPAAAATAASTEKPPNEGKIRKGLDEAIAILESVMVKISRKVGYDIDLPLAEAIAGTLTPLNLDDCIKTEIAEVKALVLAAKNLVKAPALDFAGGEAKLGEAMRVGKAAEIKAGLFKKIKAALAPVGTFLTAIKASPDKVGMTKQIARLEAMQTKITALKAANKYADALKIAEEAKALTRAYKGHSVPQPAIGGVAQPDVVVPGLLDAYKKYAAERKQYVTDNLGFIQGKPAIAAELAAIMAMIAEVDKAAAISAYKVAKEQCSRINAKILTAYNLNKAAGKYTTDLAAVDIKIAALKAKTNKAVAKTITEVDAAKAKAVAQAAKREFANADVMILAVGKTCNDAMPIAAKYQLFLDAKTAASTALREAMAHKEFESVRPLLVRSKGKFDNAIAMEAAGKNDDARALLLEVPKDCKDALAAATSSAEGKKISDAVDGLKPDDKKGFENEVMNTNLLMTEIANLCSGHPEGSFSLPLLMSISAALEKVEVTATTDLPGAFTELKAIIGQCAAARLKIGQITLFKRSCETTMKRISDMASSHAKKDYIKQDTDALLARVEKLLQAAMASGDQKPGVAALEVVVDDMFKVQALGDAQLAYETKRDVLQPKLLALEKHDARYAIKDEIDKIRAKLKEAAGKVSERKHKEAMALLAIVQSEVTDATVTATLHSNVEPKLADIKEILARPNGTKELDKIVEGLDASTKRKVLEVAFEARFGCDLKLKKKAAGATAANMTYDDANMEKAGPNIARFYEVMCDLPPSDTLNNDSLLIFDASKDGSGSSYSSGTKKVLMREGDAATASAYKFGDPYEVGTVPDNCKPANDDPVDFFSWNTLHEVGHAVDDKHGFMKSKIGVADFGGWKEYGKDVAPIAKAIATQYKYDAAYISAYMLGTKEPPLPANPTGVEPDEWERCRIRARAYVDDASVDRKPWSSAAAANRLAIGGKVYHQSYSWSWSEYNLASRGQAITAYQWRAPGEWFAELYAAYKSKKLKADHPAVVKWLKDL